MVKNGKKKILISVLIILLLSGSGFAVYNFLSSKEPKKERGEIGSPVKEEDIMEQEIKAEKELATDEDMYKELASHAYRGTVNYRDLIFVFKPLDYPLENAMAKYECTVLEQDDTPYSNHTVYTVNLNKKTGLSLSYITGPYESTFDCTYKDGVVNINGTNLEQMPLEDIEDFVYEYGNYQDITAEEHGQF